MPIKELGTFASCNQETNLKRRYKKEGDRLFSGLCCDRTSGNGFKQKECRFRLDIQKTFFMLMIVKNWNRLHRKVVDVPSLDMFKVRLDRAFFFFLFFLLELRFF